VNHPLANCTINRNKKSFTTAFAEMGLSKNGSYPKITGTQSCSNHLQSIGWIEWSAHVFPLVSHGFPVPAPGAKLRLAAETKSNEVVDPCS